MPPAHSFDRRIHLQPATPSLAMRPYRYPQILKDEVEAQCAAMLAQGIIRVQHFCLLGPVLLMRKRDETWCFCVDYRALNSNMVRNRFPIPVIDELLDKLKGAAFFSKLNLRSN
jgi:hypothetical protein